MASITLLAQPFCFLLMQKPSPLGIPPTSFVLPRLEVLSPSPVDLRLHVARPIKLLAMDHPWHLPPWSRGSPMSHPISRLSRHSWEIQEIQKGSFVERSEAIYIYMSNSMVKSTSGQLDRQKKTVDLEGLHSCQKDYGEEGLKQRYWKKYLESNHHLFGENHAAHSSGSVPIIPILYVYMCVNYN